MTSRKEVQRVLKRGRAIGRTAAQVARGRAAPEAPEAAVVERPVPPHPPARSASMEAVVTCCVCFANTSRCYRAEDFAELDARLAEEGFGRTVDGYACRSCRA